MEIALEAYIENLLAEDVDLLNEVCPLECLVVRELHFPVLAKKVDWLLE